MSYSPQFEKEYEDGWEDFPSEDTLITAHSLNMYDGTFEHIEDYLEDHPIAQTTTMPTASASELGNVYQFVGETTATFTQGYFYKCVSDGEDPATYSWQNINVQSGGGGGASALSDLTDVNIVSPTDGEGLIYNGSNQKWKNGNAPSALTNDYWNNSTTYAVGDIVIYLNGLYRCIVANTGQTPTSTAYWESISLADISKNIYSETEQAVGTWIDGKTIYRKVVKYTGTFYGTTSVSLNTGLTNVELILPTTYINAVHSANTIIPLSFVGYADSQGNNVGYFFSNNATKLNLRMGSSYTDSVYLKQINAVYEYTKTA